MLLSALGARVFEPLLRGARAQLLGSSTEPHSFAFAEDVGRAAAALGTDDRALGRAWIAPHAPATTQGEMVAAACRALGVAPRVAVVPPLLLRLAGLFDSGARASVEMMYEFTAPFVVASSAMETAFGLAATPVEAGIERTVAWYRARAAAR